MVQLVWPTDDVLTWTYDAAGNRRTRVTEQGTTTYTFDANAQLTQLVNEHAEVTTFVYGPSGREIEKWLDNGTRTSLTYDPAGQITTIVQADDSGSPFLTLEYQYDGVGNRTSLLETDALSAQQSTLWSYDATSQLLSEANAVDSVEVSRTTFVYDPVGNRLLREVDSELTTSTYDAANRLQTAEDFSGVTTYIYDANGNQRSIETPVGDVTTYTWSYENQLIGVEQPDDVVTTYAYAPVNRNSDELRLSKETDAGTVQFVWDNQNIIRELDETGLVETEYTLNPQPYGDLVSQHREAESTFYHFDALGSTRVLTDGNAVETDTYVYAAFGQLESSTGSTPNQFTYVGELGYYFDEETGDFYIRHRQYRPDQNRFTSEDPILFASGTTGLYEYVGNNPVTGVDPSGTEPPAQVSYNRNEKESEHPFLLALSHQIEINRIRAEIKDRQAKSRFWGIHYSTSKLQLELDRHYRALDKLAKKYRDTFVLPEQKNYGDWWNAFYSTHPGLSPLLVSAIKDGSISLEFVRGNARNPDAIAKMVVEHFGEKYFLSSVDITRVYENIPVTEDLLSAWRAWANAAKAALSQSTYCFDHAEAIGKLPETKQLERAGYSVSIGDPYKGHYGLYVWVNPTSPDVLAAAKDIPRYVTVGRSWAVFHVGSGYNSVHHTTWDGDFPIKISFSGDHLTGIQESWFSVFGFGSYPVCPPN